MKKMLQVCGLPVLPLIFAFLLICSSFIVSASAYVITSVGKDEMFFVKIDTDTDKTKKYIALTFDDGPHPIYTKQILDILEEKNISATFFVVGFRAKMHPDELLRMKELNCEIGNHTYEHKDLKRISHKDALSEINKCNEIIYNITGEYPAIYRPPFGNITNDLEKKIDMIKIMWTVDSLDWKNHKSRVLNDVLKDTRKAGEQNSIILLHDFFDTTTAVLPQIIDTFLAENYEFVTISELLEIDCSVIIK